MSFTLNLFSQAVKYLDQLYPIEVSYDHLYGENATILFFPDLGEAIKESLHFDLYKPINPEDECDGDSLQPLIIYFHSGNFLPFPYNQNIVGTKRDSSVVGMCRRLASTGYVVASADYRLGWNPFAPELEARAGIINAAYRGVQDANTCIRYFKKTVAEDGNPFGIDTSRIILFGDDSGGYLSLHAGCLDSYSKIPTASKGKFLFPTNLPAPYPPFIPMVIESLNGDVEGKNFGIMTVELSSFLPFPVGDTLCYSNYPEYSSKFSASVNLGGAVADTAWMDPGQPPVICVHAPYDKTTPCGEDFVYVAEERIIEVQGSCALIPLANSLGNNACLSPPFYSNGFQSNVTAVANTRSGGVENLFLVIGDTITDGTPWNFWDCATNPNCANGLITNPHMSREKAESYMDSILAYVLPRLYQCLDLCTVSTDENLDPNDISIVTFPNPAIDEVFIGSQKDYLIRNLTVYDMKGSLVNHFRDINLNYFYLPVDKLVPGQYVLKLQFDQGIAARQIVIQ